MSIPHLYSACVFSSNQENAFNLLDEIARTKSLGQALYKRVDRFTAVFVYGSGELRWVRPSDSSRGMRFGEVWIDLSIAKDIIDRIIIPCCIGGSASIHYF